MLGEARPLQANWSAVLGAGMPGDTMWPTGENRSADPMPAAQWAPVESQPTRTVHTPSLDGTKPLQANWSAVLDDNIGRNASGTVGAFSSSSSGFQSAVYEATTEPREQAFAPSDQARQAQTQRPETAPTDRLPDVAQLGGESAALDGFCPVELSENERWQSGDSRWSVTYQGRTYLLSGESQRQRFLTNPERYAPSYSGNDPVLAVDENRRESGRPTTACSTTAGSTCSPARGTVARFKKDPRRYAAGGRQ